MSCLAVIKASRPVQLPGLWLVAVWRGNINVLGNKTHLSTAAAFPLQTTAATHKVGQELQSGSYVFIRRTPGSQPCPWSCIVNTISLVPGVGGPLLILTVVALLQAVVASPCNYTTTQSLR